MENATHRTAEQIKILRLLAKEYPGIPAASATLVSLNALCNLPKGTEHFMSDLHGEAEAFEHILNNCSGVIREKVDNIFYRTMSESQRRSFCTLIYYPAEKLEEVRQTGEATDEWYRVTLYRLVDLARSVASKYSRAKVREALPEDFQYIIDELLHTSGEEHDKQAYYQNIIGTVIEVGMAGAFIEALCRLIKRMAVDRLHVVGDIYDRGARPDRILDMLMEHHRVDIQWGNHDIVWMGAAAGSAVCVATVLNSALQYNTLAIVENTYGISLRDLIGFAQETYKGCTWFMPRSEDDAYYVKNRMDTLSKAHKAIAIIMFKLEGQLIRRHPEYGMDDRLLLEHIDYTAHTVTIDGQVYPLNDAHFPTVDPADPYRLTAGEEAVVRDLSASFAKSERLRRHVRFLYDNGRLYRCYNGNLLFHGCIPMTEAGNFDQVTFDGECYQGRALMDHHERMARRAYFDRAPDAVDFMWYLWCGERSPLCGRSIKTFERAFVNCPEAWQEPMNPYYRHINDEAVCRRILSAFGLDSPEAHIINGHTPIHVSSGESPVKANGRLIVIDGGFCKAYQKATGIAGYTLISNSHGLRIVAHQPFSSLTRVLANDDIHSDSQILWQNRRRCLVADTDNGRQIQQRIRTLEELLNAYRSGLLTPRGE